MIAQPQRPASQRPEQQSKPCSQVCPASLHAQRPPAQSIVPQHSALERHPLPGPVQHRWFPRRRAHRRPPQHSLAVTQLALSPATRHPPVEGAQRPAAQTKPGQQSPPAQVSPDPRQRQ